MNSRLSSLRMPRLVLILALSLVLWVSGAGCLIGCENMAMAAPNEVGFLAPDTDTVVANESCASAATHNCCAKHHGSAKHQQAAGKGSTNTNLKLALATTQATMAFLLPASGGTMNACPFAMNAGAVATTARADESKAMVAISPVALPSINSRPTGAPSLSPAWFSNRGHTYLRCCVFLI